MFVIQCVQQSLVQSVTAKDKDLILLLQQTRSMNKSRSDGEREREEGREEGERNRERINIKASNWLYNSAGTVIMYYSLLFQIVYHVPALIFLFGRYSQFSQIKKNPSGRHILEATYLQKCSYSSKDACTASNIIQATTQKTRTFLSISPQPEQYTKINPLLTAFTSNITGPSNAVYKSQSQECLEYSIFQVSSFLF